MAYKFQMGPAHMSGTLVQSGSLEVRDIDSAGALRFSVDGETGNTTVGNDLSLDSDSSVFNMGAGSDFTITHDGTTGATIAGNPVTITSAGAATWSTSAGALTIDSAGALTMDTDGTDAINLGTEAAAKTITIGADASTTVDINALDIQLDAGSGGYDIDGAGNSTLTTSGTGTLTIDSAGALTMDTDGTDAINLGTEAAAKTITVGNAASTAVNLNALASTITTVNALALTDGTATFQLGGTGATTLAAATTVDLDSTSTMSLNSSAGAINVGNDDVDQAVNVGTAGERTVTVGNVSGATTLALNAGTGGVAIASTGAGDITINSDDTLLLDSDGVLELNTSGGAIGIGNDAVAVNTTVGNVTGTTSVTLNSGTGGIALASTGTGDITLNSDDTLLLDADGVLELNSSAGAINIGNDADAFAIAIGTGGAARTISVGNETGATALDFDAGTGGVTIDSQGAGTIAIGTQTDTGAINIGVGASARTITVGNDASTKVDVNALTIELDSAGDIALSADGGNVTMDDGSTTVFNFDTDNVSLKMMDDADTGDYLQIAVGTHGATTITTLDDDAAAANLTMTIDGTVDIDSQGLITLDSGAGIALEPAAGSAVLIDGTVSIDAGVVTGVTSLAAGTVTLSGLLSSSAGANVIGNAAFGGTLAVTGNFNADGNVTLGDASGDSLTVNGQVVKFSNLAANTFDETSDSLYFLDSSNASQMNKVTMANLYGRILKPAGAIGSEAQQLMVDINGLGALTTLADGDEFVISDFSDSHNKKKITFANLKTNIVAGSGDSISVSGAGDHNLTLQAGIVFCRSASIAAARTWTLPADPTAGDIIVAKASKVGAFYIRITASGDQTIDGETYVDLQSNSGSVSLCAVTAGSNAFWKIY